MESMETMFSQFKKEVSGSSLNEILNCAKKQCYKLSLVKDVDEYTNNEFAFVVRWYLTYARKENESIDIECMYSHLTGKPEFTLLNEEVTKFGRTWKVVKDLDLTDDDIWWKVLEMEDGVLWMDNINGEMAFVENNGRILVTTF